jgi:hypothetical protein
MEVAIVIMVFFAIGTVVSAAVKNPSTTSNIAGGIFRMFK